MSNIQDCFDPNPQEGIKKYCFNRLLSTISDCLDIDPDYYYDVNPSQLNDEEYAIWLIIDKLGFYYLKDSPFCTGRAVEILNELSIESKATLIDEVIEFINEEEVYGLTRLILDGVTFIIGSDYSTSILENSTSNIYYIISSISCFTVTTNLTTIEDKITILPASETILIVLLGENTNVYKEGNCYKTIDMSDNNTNFVL